MRESRKRMISLLIHFVKQYHLFLVLILSTLHVGLAYLHVRDSGKADQPRYYLKYSRLLYRYAFD